MVCVHIYFLEKKKYGLYIFWSYRLRRKQKPKYLTGLGGLQPLKKKFEITIIPWYFFLMSVWHFSGLLVKQIGISMAYYEYNLSNASLHTRNSSIIT